MNTYVPILKGKAGEFAALRELSDPVRKTILPFFDVPRIPLNSLGVPSRTIESHIEKFVSDLNKGWPTDRSAFVDTYDIDLGMRTNDGRHPIEYLGELAKKSTHRLILTTGLDRDDAHHHAVFSAQNELENGICIRLLKEDLELPDQSIEEISQLIDLINMDTNKIDLLLDFRFLPEDEIDLNCEVIRLFINSDEIIKEFRSLILASSGFPQTMSGIPKMSKTRVRRTEIEMWSKLANSSKNLVRTPTYSDYGVVHPDLKDVNPRVMRPSAKIRYTLENDWLILKGQGLSTDPKGYAQYHDLSEDLISTPEFEGAKFSWGDSYIHDCAKQTVGTGNLQKWVSVDTNHHITLVALQASSFAVS